MASKIPDPFGAHHSFLHGQRRAERLCALVGEAGFGQRPLMVWLGPPGPSLALRPFAYDNAGYLSAIKGQFDTQRLTGDVTSESGYFVRRAELCAAAELLLDGAPELQSEREEVERNVGITAIGTLGACLIDTKRVDWHAASLSLAPSDIEKIKGAVIVEIHPHFEGFAGDIESLLSIGRVLGNNLRAICVVDVSDDLVSGRAQRRLKASDAPASVALQTSVATLRAEGALQTTCQTTEFEVASSAPLLASLRAASMWLSSAKR